MKNIDFLPEYYRRRNELRRARLWWGVCAGIFGLVIAATSMSQWWMRRSALQQLAMVEPLHTAAANQDQRFAELQAKVAKEGETANLFVYLKHPWPKTQIMAALVNDLPAAVTISSVNIHQEAIVKPVEQSGNTRKQRKTDDAAANGKPSAVRDLTALRQASEESQTCIQLQGQAHDQTQLHAYAAILGKCPLFRSAELKSIEVSTERPGAAPAARFEMRIIVRPGYGQPDGPRETKAAPAVDPPPVETPDDEPFESSGEEVLWLPASPSIHHVAKGS